LFLLKKQRSYDIFKNILVSAATQFELPNALVLLLQDIKKIRKQVTE